MEAGMMEFEGKMEDEMNGREEDRGESLDGEGRARRDLKLAF